MKRKSLFVFSVLVTLILTVFVVSTASAATGCFTDTNGHWAETFICWMKDNGITTGTGGGNYSPEDNVTRAQMAVFMQKLDELAVAQDATNLAAAKAYTDTSLSTGVTYIGAGNTAWQKNGSSANSYIEYYTNVIRLRSTAAGTYGYQLTASLPDSLFNHLMYLNGVQICYDATDVGATLTDVYLQHWWGGATPSIYKEVSDPTDRNDAACRTYSIATPGSLFGNNHVDVYVQVNFVGAGDIVDMTSTTFILSPSASPGFLNPVDDLGPTDSSGPAAGSSEANP